MNIKSSLCAFFTASLFATSLNAATIELHDGRSLEAEILAKEANHLLLDMNGIEVKLPTEQVASIDFGTNKAAPQQNASTPSEEAIAKSNASTTVPAGTSMTIRMSETVNTRQHHSGQRFTATLEANLMAGDQIIAQRGSTVYGELSEVKKAGRVAGEASMSMTLTGIIINDQMHELKTDVLSSSGTNTAANTAGKTARAAAIGGLIDGSDGAKTGAKVGVGASILTQGNDISLPKDSLVEFTLIAPLNS